MARMYEIKMWLRSNPTVLAWHFYIHDNGKLEFVKQPIIQSQADFDMLNATKGTMMNFMFAADIADMKCTYIPPA